MKTAFVYATDENYVKLTAVSLCSLLKTNTSHPVIVLSSDISAESQNLLHDLANRMGRSLQILDTNIALSELKTLGANGYVSFSVYSRLFIPALLGNTFDRAVYLDSDTLIMGSLDPLCQFNLKGKSFAIGYDCISNKYKKLINLPPTAPYFNSGMLVLDLAEWKRHLCTERILDYMKKVRHDLMFGDQDYFALVLADDAAILPPEYNFLTHFQMFKTRKAALCATGTPECAWYNETQYAAAQKRPIVHHFLGHTLGRPWYRESLNPLREIYRHFAAEAGVPEVAEQSRPVEFHYRLQHLLWRYLPQPLFALAVRAMYTYYFRSHYGV